MKRALVMTGLTTVPIAIVLTLPTVAHRPAQAR
jgi:hypothetical protein